MLLAIFLRDTFVSSLHSCITSVLTLLPCSHTAAMLSFPRPKSAACCYETGSLVSVTAPSHPLTHLFLLTTSYTNALLPNQRLPVCCNCIALFPNIYCQTQPAYIVDFISVHVFCEFTQFRIESVFLIQRFLIKFVIILLFK